jgi:hypothetical protein
MGQVYQCWWRICQELNVFAPGSSIACFTFPKTLYGTVVPASQTFRSYCFIYIEIFVRYSRHQRNKIYLLYVSIFCKGYTLTGYKATPINPTIPLTNPTYDHPFKDAAITAYARTNAASQVNARVMHQTGRNVTVGNVAGIEIRANQTNFIHSGIQQNYH